MRTERLTLRSTLLLVAAVLSGLIWAATLLGLGKRIPAHHFDSGALPVLPRLEPAADDPMTAAGSFAAVTERPVFAEDRRPHPFRLGGPQATAGGALRLTGVLLSGDFGMATLSGDQDRSLRLRLNGEAVEGWQLLALEPRRATVLGPDGAQVLELVVFNGQGGQPPTQLRDPRTGARPASSAAVVLPASPAPAQAAGSPRNAPGDTPASSAAADPAANQGPSEEQMRAIRDRIRARREQLQQQQQQRQSTSPPGDAANR